MSILSSCVYDAPSVGAYVSVGKDVADPYPLHKASMGTLFKTR